MPNVRYCEANVGESEMCRRHAFFGCDRNGHDSDFKGSQLLSCSACEALFAVEPGASICLRVRCRKFIVISAHGCIRAGGGRGQREVCGQRHHGQKTGVESDGFRQLLRDIFVA